MATSGKAVPVAVGKKHGDMRFREYVSVASSVDNSDSTDTLADADKIPVVVDGVLKHIPYSDFLALLKTYFDTLYVSQ